MFCQRRGIKMSGYIRATISSVHSSRRISKDRRPKRALDRNFDSVRISNKKGSLEGACNFAHTPFSPRRRVFIRISRRAKNILCLVAYTRLRKCVVRAACRRYESALSAGFEGAEGRKPALCRAHTRMEDPRRSARGG